MSLPIDVEAHSGYRSNERPKAFTLDEEIYDIEEVEEQWRTPEAMYFRVRSTEGKRYVLRYDERSDDWSLESAFDGVELFARPGIEFITVEPKTIRAAEGLIAGCDSCRPEQSEVPFDWILAEVLDKHGPYEFVLAETARCPNCKAPISEKTPIERHGGIEVEANV